MSSTHSFLFDTVAQEIAELPFTPGHEMVGKVGLGLLTSRRRAVCVCMQPDPVPPTDFPLQYFFTQTS